MSRALIVYGTRYGATAGTAAEIAVVLHQEGLEVRAVDAKQEKAPDLEGYDLVIVGSGMRIEKWTRAADAFLERYREELARRRVALFVSSGAMAMVEHEGRKDEAARMRRKYLEDKTAGNGLRPVTLGMFGGIWDFNRLPLWTKLLPAGKDLMAETRAKLEAAGYRETEPGVYDTRDWGAIRSWARSLVEGTKTTRSSIQVLGSLRSDGGNRDRPKKDLLANGHGRDWPRRWHSWASSERF
jgi:menaquinone-dependent protoporphyrinogen oxidase